VIINNQGTTLVPISFNQTRTFPILMKPSDYYMSIIRFQIPGLTIPYFTFVNGTYSVTLQYQNTIVQTNLIYISDNTGSAQTVSSYQQFLDMVNVALATSYTGLGMLPTSTVAPYMIYDPPTQLFSLIVDKGYVTDGARVFFNEALALKFPNFQYIITIPIGSGLQGKDSEIVLGDKKNNTYNTTFWQMSQSGPSFWSWPSWGSILYIGNVNTPAEYYNSLSGNSSNDFKIQLTDFEPGINAAQDATSLFTYFPSGPYRLIDMKQNSPMSDFNFNIYYVDKQSQVQTQLYLFPGTVCTTKIMFRKKSLGP
jgi:hypothetical protein